MAQSIYPMYYTHSLSNENSLDFNLPATILRNKVLKHGKYALSVFSKIIAIFLTRSSRSCSYMYCKLLSRLFQKFISEIEKNNYTDTIKYVTT